MYQGYKRSFPGVVDITPEEGLKLISNPEVVWVDVREDYEQEVSMIPGALRHKDFLEKIEKYQGRLIIGYCTISYRSGKLAQELSKKGIKMRNLSGGLLAWLHSGGPVHKEGKAVRRLHVYGRRWDLAPLAYKTIY